MTKDPKEIKSEIEGVEFPKMTVYWRPGCPFCMNLQRQIDKHHLPHQKINIWDDPSGAAFVRGVADGNEVVPTISIGSTSMVNPSIKQILDAVNKESGGKLDEDGLASLKKGQAKPLGKLLRRILSE